MPKIDSLGNPDALKHILVDLRPLKPIADSKPEAEDHQKDRATKTTGV